MIVVVDAYNILKQVMPTLHITDRQRERFLSMVGAYATIKKLILVVVFDGGPHQWPHKEKRGGVEIIYSGTRQTADEYIRTYIQGNKEKELLLVTSDRALCSWAVMHRVESVDAVPFYTTLKMATQKKEDRVVQKESDVPVKTSQNTVAELDELMMQGYYGSLDTKEEDDQKNNLRDGNRRQDSKQERAAARKIKKL